MREGTEALRRLVREFFTGLRGPRADLDRLRLLALVKLVVVVPFVMVPFGLSFEDFARGDHVFPIRTLFHGWLTSAAVIVASNAALLGLARHGPAAERRARLLTYVSLVSELGSNQISTYAVGSIIGFTGFFIVVIVASYRVAYDYELGLAAMIAGIALFVGVAALEIAGAIPAHPAYPDIALPLYELPPEPYATIQASVAGIVVAFMAVNFAMNQALKLHRYITESVLRRYLPASMVARAARGELRLDAEPDRRTVTVMFADMVGFTPLSERLDPDALGRLINQFLARIADLSHRHGATIDKFVGDAVMVVFGAPDDMPPGEQARRCVALARDIHAALAGGIDGVAVQTRIGINTGEAVVGNFGSATRSDFTVIGPTVNLAARLEAAGKPGRTLVGEETAGLLGDEDVSLEQAGSLELKGVSRPVTAYFAD